MRVLLLFLKFYSVDFERERERDLFVLPHIYVFIVCALTGD